MLSSAEAPASLVDSFTFGACCEAVAAASRIAAATACIAASSPVAVWAAEPAAIYSSLTRSRSHHPGKLARDFSRRQANRPQREISWDIRHEAKVARAIAVRMPSPYMVLSEKKLLTKSSSVR